MWPYIYRARQNIFQFHGCNAKNCSKIFFFLRSKHHVCLKLRNLNHLLIRGEQSCHNISAWLNNLNFSPYRKTTSAQHTFILSYLMCSYFQVSFQTPLFNTNCSFPVHLLLSQLLFKAQLFMLRNCFWTCSCVHRTAKLLLWRHLTEWVSSSRGVI